MDKPEANEPIVDTARPRSRTSAPPSITSCSAAASRGSTFWAGRGAPHSWRPTPPRTREGRTARALRAGSGSADAVAGAGRPGKLGAYRIVNREAAKERWLTGVPEDKKAELIPAGWFDAWADATFATDPVGAAINPPVLRAPNGVVQDGAEYLAPASRIYDPAGITVPTLLVHAEWDRDTPPYMAQTLFPLLVNAPGKRYVALAEGTHTHHHGAESPAAVRSGAAVPRRGEAAR